MELQSWEGWKPWLNLSTIEWKDVPQGPGTYMIGAGRSLKRAIGTDKWGILDIGKSTRLRNRLRIFWRCARGEAENGHSAGWRFCFFSMGHHFSLSSLTVSWREAKDENEAAREEGRMLDEYVKQHMETPPLNCSSSWRHL